MLANKNLWREADGSFELLLGDATDEERKAHIALLSEEGRAGLVSYSLDWRPEFTRPRTLIKGHINGWARRNPAHDGGGVKLEITCYNQNLEIAQADTKEAWRLIRETTPKFKVYDRGYKLVVILRKEEGV